MTLDDQGHSAWSSLQDGSSYQNLSTVALPAKVAQEYASIEALVLTAEFKKGTIMQLLLFPEDNALTPPPVKEVEGFAIQITPAGSSIYPGSEGMDLDDIMWLPARDLARWQFTPQSIKKT